MSKAKFFPPQWSALLLPIVLLVSANANSLHLQQQVARGEPRDVTTVRVESIAGKPASFQDGFVFDSLHEGQGVDVVIGGYGVGDEDDVFLLVRPHQSDKYQIFGPARRQKQEDDRVVWVIPDVVLPYHGINQRKHYVFRAAIAPRGQIKNSSASSLEEFSAVSWPTVPVAVLQWIPKPSGLTIDLVDGRPIEPKLTVEASADITGSIEKIENGRPYLILHAANSNLWRVLGPAEVRGSVWQMRDVSLSDPGQPNWRYVDVFAFQSQQKFDSGPVAYSAWVEKMVAASPSVRLWVKDEEVTPQKQIPQVEFTRYLTSDGKAQPLNGARDGSITVGDIEISVQATVRNPPQGKSFWAALNPLGSPIWLVQDGPGLINGNSLTFPRVRLEVPSDLAANRFRFVVVAADSALPMGAADYSVLQSRGVVVSPFLFLERGPTGRLPSQPEITLSIVTIAGVAVEAGKDIHIAGHGSVEIQVDGLPSGGQVWIARNRVGEDSWTFFPASLSANENIWLVPEMEFANQPGAPSDGAAPISGGYETLAAFVTLTSLPVQSGTFAAWRPYARAISPLVRIGDSSTLVLQSSKLPSTQTDAWTIKWPVWVTALFLLFLLFLLLEYLFRLTSLIAGELQKVGESTYAYVHSQFREVPRPNVPKTIVGLLLLGLGILAIASYLPIYEDILQNSLNLSGRQSHSLALLLIIFIALTGVIADVTNHYGRGGAEEQPASNLDLHQNVATRSNGHGAYPAAKTQFTYVFGVSVVLLIALALLMFQGILYFEFYKTHAAEGSNIPFAFGAAALFIAGIEMLGFFWATRLSLDFISWTVLHLTLFVPPLLLARVALVVKHGFQALPSRVQVKESERQTDVVLPERDARQMANVYILTTLGDRLQADSAEWLEADQYWRFRVVDKEFKKERGALYIDGQTGTLTWQPTVRKDQAHGLANEQPFASA